MFNHICFFFASEENGTALYPVFNITPPTMEVEYGGPVKVYCSIPNIPSMIYNLGWESKMGDGQLETKSTVVLDVPSWTEWETNKMMCYLTRPELIKCKIVFNLTIYNKPMITQDLPNILLMVEGGRHTLTFSARVNPSAQYKWTIPGNQTLSNASVTIHSMRSEDQGLYTCTASNGQGVAHTSVAVKITCECQIHANHSYHKHIHMNSQFNLNPTLKCHTDIAKETRSINVIDPLNPGYYSHEEGVQYQCVDMRREFSISV
ncbi:hypothetical protein P4O66_021713 [Electrophorus voltai]|uniref:Ig-like domain-containing protein n=1 Tax=Electrophorus voltai TaxID=2609070 RepID=A0AAD9E5R6_9TELE|nr:hypothetical protein P4O66_021713 [Electrophorus voltai]